VHESRQGSNYEIKEMVGVMVVKAYLYLTKCTRRFRNYNESPYYKLVLPMNKAIHASFCFYEGAMWLGCSRSQKAYLITIHYMLLMGKAPAQER
jgi:TATA-box binding protein (TBP) (component of TFIID and TFIIIB)